MEAARRFATGRRRTDGGGGAPAPSPADQERQARAQGWAPREQWKGNPNNWVDAGEFLKRSETFVPFLQRERRQLRTELNTRDARIAILEGQVSTANEQLAEIRRFNEEMATDRRDRRKREISGEMNAAREANDHVRFSQLSTELNEITARERQAPRQEPPARQQPPQGGGNPPPQGGGGGNQPPQIQPWVQNFIDDNADFFKDKRNVSYFNAEMTIRRSEGDNRVGEVDGTALLQEALDTVQSRSGGNSLRRAPSKSEGSNPPTGGGGGTGGARTYAELPPDGRAQCDAQQEKFVGKGKLFEKVEDWRRFFVGEYFGPSATAMSRTTGDQ